MLNSEAVEGLLAFLPPFERGDYALADSHYRATGQNSPEVNALLRAITIYTSTLLGFNWVAWSDEVRRYAKDVRLLDQADLDTVQKLLLVSVRQDRFSGGLMSYLCASGFLAAVLRRFAGLQSQQTEVVST